MLNLFLTLLSSFFILSSSLTLADSSGPMGFCRKELESFPVLSQGREKPFGVMASESLRFMTGKEKLEGLSASEAFCKLSLLVFGMPIKISVPIKVDHVEVRKFLGLQEDVNFIEVEELQKKSSLLKEEVNKIKENNSYKKELKKVLSRLSTYEAIASGLAWTVPVKEGEKITFIPLREFLTPQRLSEAQTEKVNPVFYHMNKAQSDYLALKGDHYLLELTYFKYQFFLWAMILSLLSIILFVSMKNKIPGGVVTFFSIALQLVAISMRVLISGRAPITNMYETVMFSGFGALIISLIIYFFRKEILFVLAGLSCNVLSLMMMKFANGMLDEGISPLVPVLRDNFWLSTHVTTVILSYAALALSWILANSLLIRARFLSTSVLNFRYEVDLIYTSIKFGVVLLSAGVILGGVWADYSWGRFWGWDPKETWSLIVLLVYMAILHGRYTSWISPARFVPLVAGAFMSVMMAWFGVNYILASGLHSYGFSEGGAVFLGSFFIAQIVLLAICTYPGVLKKG